MKLVLVKSSILTGNKNKSNQMLVFEERGKLEYPRKNLSEQSREPTNSIHKNGVKSGIDPEPHRWKVSAFTTVPALLLKYSVMDVHWYTGLVSSLCEKWPLFAVRDRPDLLG